MPSYFTISPCTAGSCIPAPCANAVIIDDDEDITSETCCPSHGNGSPEGVLTKPEGSVYVDDLTQSVYIKVIGEDAYGWMLFTGASSPAVGIYNVGSIAQARLIPRNITNLQMHVNGDLTGGDGVSHLYYDWDQGDSTTPNNNGSVLDPLLPGPGAGRWKQN